MIRLGVLRLHWCFRPEGMIRSLKKSYLNVNNRALSKSVTARWYLCEALKDFSKLYLPSLSSKTRTATSEFGEITAGRFATAVLNDTCTLIEVLKVQTGDQLSIKVHGSVILSEGRCCACLNPPQVCISSSEADDLAPCIVIPAYGSSWVEVVMIANEMHKAFIDGYQA